MAEMRSFDRRRRLADALLQQSLTPGQGGQMVGRYYVGSGLTDGLTKLGQALIARSAYKRADEEESQFGQQQQATRQAALDELMQATSPQEIQQENTVVGDTGGMDIPAPTATYTTKETRQPTPQQIAAALMGYEARTGAPLSDTYAKMLAPGVNGNEWLGVTQTDEKGTVYGATKQGGWQPLGFNAKPGEPKPPQTRSFEDERGRKVTQEWTGSGYKTIAVGPAPVIKPEKPDVLSLEERAKLEQSFRKEYNGLNTAFTEIKRARGNILSSLGQNTAAGDIAAASSLMKLLDPDSVVRESELAMAQNATGAVDRLYNYAQKIKTGETLNPQQRQDYISLANQLFANSEKDFNIRRADFTRMSTEYGLKPENIVGSEGTAGWKIERAD